MPPEPNESESSPSSRGDRDDALPEREAILAAFTRIAAERGYWAMTAADVTAAADLPEEVFFEHFESRQQCLAEAYDAYYARLISQVTAEMDRGLDWPTQLRAAVRAGLEFVAETARPARFFAVEALSAGPLIQDRYAAAVGQIVVLLRMGRELHAGPMDLPQLLEPVLVGGVASLVTGVLLVEEPERLAALEPEIVRILLTPYIGLGAADRVAA